ncbi:MAG: HPr kinase/phosphorylase, partial [Clostridia bacterium]
MDSEINIGIEEQNAEFISAKVLSNKFKFKGLYVDDDCLIKLSTVSVNRPGLILCGFDDYFAKSRIQVMGNAEMYYLYNLDDTERDEALKKLFRMEVPCLIISRGLAPCKNMIELAKEYKCPVFQSAGITSELVNDLINFLNDLLAPKTNMHGVLLDIDGVGVLLTGRSGIGKSETALELVHRGHMLVS